VSRFLSRVGTFSAAHRWVVAGVWILIAAAFTVMTISGAKFSDAPFSIGGAESTTALATMQKQFPELVNPHEGELLLVVEAADGATVTSDKAVTLIGAAVARAREVPDVLSASDPYDEDRPFISGDDKVAVSTLAVNIEADQVKVEADLRAAAAALTRSGFGLEVGGTLEDGPPEILGLTEAVGAVIAFVVLLLTFGSLVAAGANMLMAFAGVIVGVLGILAWSSTGDGIQSTTLVMAVMLSLAVGIDYALLIISRYRDELRSGADPATAIARSSATAGSSVVVAGATVVIALAGLAIVDIPFITEMGLGAAFGVVVAVLLSLTVVPAVLMRMGRKALPKRERNAAPAEVRSREGKTALMLSRWVKLVVRRPVMTSLLGVAIIATLAAPVLTLQTELDPPGGSDPDSSQRAAYETVSKAFGPGSQDPLVVLFEGGQSVAAAESSTTPIAAMSDVADVSPVQASDNKRTAFLTVTSKFGPTDERTGALVQDLRDHMKTVAGSKVSVTGQTAVNVDVDKQLSSGLIIYLACVVALSLVLLAMVFRSIAIPVLATIGFLMSLAAGIGVATAVFQHGWGGALVSLEEARPIASLVPLIVIGVLFGLAMDYQVFLVSRIHEAHRQGLVTRQAVIAGFRHASPVVLAAATIMAAVFAGFAFSGGDPMVATVGLALAVGVLVDVLIVRMVLVPAALELMGEASWWIPRWLNRVLPNLDVEGQSFGEPEKSERDEELEPVH
jgi:RND superfamily putative drug exporter